VHYRRWDPLTLRRFLQHNCHAPRGTTTHEKRPALLCAWAIRYNALSRVGREVVFGLVPRACDTTGPGYLLAPPTVASFPREVEHARQPLALRVSRQPSTCVEMSDGRGVSPMCRLGCP